MIRNCNRNVDFYIQDQRLLTYVYFQLEFYLYSNQYQFCRHLSSAGKERTHKSVLDTCFVYNGATVYKGIGVGRFRKLGGQGLEYWGAKFPAGTWRRDDVDAT